jgi:hypothetical protein
MLDRTTRIGNRLFLSSLFLLESELFGSDSTSDGFRLFWSSTDVLALSGVSLHEEQSKSMRFPTSTSIGMGVSDIRIHTCIIRTFLILL